MKKAWILLSVVLSIALLLAGCASSPSSRAPAPAQNEAGPMQDAVAPAASAASAATAGGSQQGDSAMPVLDPGNAAQSGKKIIYTVQMALEAPDVAAAIDDITAKAAAAGGYVSQSDYSRNDGGQNGSITVRVPPERLKDFTEQMRSSYRALSAQMNSQDVTDQYVDLQSRLTNAQAQETQLLDIMKQAVKVDDILKVRQELNSVQQEIEQIKGQLRLMDNQVGYSTVSIALSEAAKAPQVSKDDGVIRLLGLRYTWDNVSKNFLNGLYGTLNALSAMLAVFSATLIPLLVVGVVVVVILVIVRLAGRRKKQP